MTPVYFYKTKITPGKIVCIGRNYVAHIAELGNQTPDQMVVFIKPASAIGAELNSSLDEPLHYETEICFLVRNQQLSAVGVGFDLTKRQLQDQLKEKRLPWERAKAFDGSALFSEFVAMPDDISQLSVELRIDGELTQQGSVQQMLYPPQAMINELQTFLSLQDDDIIMTGTPQGVGPVRAGARYEAAIRYNDVVIVSNEWIAL